MENIKVTGDMFVMGGEPSPGLTIEKANELFNKLETETDIADLFSAVDNMAWWLEDEQYDFEVGTEEYKEVCEKTEKWFTLSEKLRNKIFDILKSKGVEIPETGYNAVLEPFMKRNGYINGNGWWIEE
ncbi:MAG: hypothetical protein IJD97_01415 [Clostridia bacterium]|nr:hypothetical protein [Clostridia bacterium]